MACVTDMDKGRSVNIVVCVKEVPDINLPLAIDFETGSLDDDDIVYTISSCDLAAVEEAVRLKEERGSGAVTIVSLGARKDARSLKKCLAIGADEAILIDVQSIEQIDTHSICTVLAEAIKTLDYDLVLCGSKAQDMQLGGGQTGPRIAALLDLPFVTEIDRIEVSENGSKSRVHQRLEKGNKYVIECSLPALFTVNENANTPRYPTFSSSLHAVRKNVSMRTADAFGLDYRELRPVTRVLKTLRPKPRQRKMAIPDSSLSAEDRIKAMLGGGTKQKESDIEEGSPDQLADSIMKFLHSLGIFDS